jgi:hypothetical protein
MFNGLPVVVINSTFNSSGNGDELTHVFFEKNENNIANIRRIGYQAFLKCKKLAYVEFPEGLEEIEASAF